MTSCDVTWIPQSCAANLSTQTVYPDIRRLRIHGGNLTNQQCLFANVYGINYSVPWNNQIGPMYHLRDNNAQLSAHLFRVGVHNFYSPPQILCNVRSPANVTIQQHINSIHTSLTSGYMNVYLNLYHCSALQIHGHLKITPKKNIMLSKTIWTDLQNTRKQNPNN